MGDGGAGHLEGGWSRPEGGESGGGVRLCVSHELNAVILHKVMTQTPLGLPLRIQM